MVNKLAHCLCLDHDSQFVYQLYGVYLYDVHGPGTSYLSKSQSQIDDFKDLSNHLSNSVEPQLILAIAANYPEYESLLGYDWNDKTYNFKTNKYEYKYYSSDINYAIDESINSFSSTDNIATTTRILSRAGLLNKWLDIRYDPDKKTEQFAILFVALALNNPHYFAYDH